MINGKKVLTIIPARGGSKGVPRKNVRDLAGKPLIAWTIEEAQKSRYIDCLILSSEDEEIIQVAKEWGCDVPFVRPQELAQDESSGMDVVLHALEEITGYDYIVLLQPTSPLRTVKEIDECIATFSKKNADSCVSVTKAEKSPYWMYTINDEGKMKNIIPTSQLITRRQDLPLVYSLNGAIYIAEINWIQKYKTFLTKHTLAFCMPKERSYDIDTELDFHICEYLLSKNNNF